MLSAADRRGFAAWKVLAIVNVFATVLMTNQACAVRESSEGINMPPIQHHSVPSAAAAAVDQVRWIRNNRPDRRHLFSVRKSFNSKGAAEGRDIFQTKALKNYPHTHHRPKKLPNPKANKLRYQGFFQPFSG